MLPTEIFADSVAFFRLYDLRALVITNARCFSLAVKEANRIRFEEFPNLHFTLERNSILTRRTGTQQDELGIHPVQAKVKLTFPSERDTVRFVAEAFPNCDFEDVAISSLLSQAALKSIGRIAHSVDILGALRTPFSMCHEESIKLFQKFRKVKVFSSSYSSLKHVPLSFEILWCSIRSSLDIATRTASKLRQNT